MTLELEPWALASPVTMSTRSGNRGIAVTVRVRTRDRGASPHPPRDPSPASSFSWVYQDSGMSVQLYFSTLSLIADFRRYRFYFQPGRSDPWFTSLSSMDSSATKAGGEGIGSELMLGEDH